MAQLALRFFKQELCVQKRDATVTPAVLSLTRSLLSARMFCRRDAVISVQTVNPKVYRHWGGGSAHVPFSPSLRVRVFGGLQLKQKPL